MTNTELLLNYLTALCELDVEKRKLELSPYALYF